MSDFTSLDYALALHRLGLSIIPVPRPGVDNDGKRPTLAWKRYQTERPSEADIRRWFATEQNIAVITGAVSGVVVVDADSPDAERWVRRNLRRTPWRVRTGRGMHFYYRHPGPPVGNKAHIQTKDGRLKLDVRGDGGYVIGPGSVHHTGAAYTSEGDWSVPSSELPAFCLRLLERPRPMLPTFAPRLRAGSTDIVSRSRAYLAAIPRPEIGQGSDDATMYAACRLVRGLDMAEADAVALLWEWAGGRAGWTEEWVAAKVRNALRYGEEQIGALR